MALNKAHTPVWMKTLIIILIVSFIGLFMSGGIIGLIDLFNQPAQTGTAAQTPADKLATINAKYQPQVDLYKQIAASQPTSYTAAVILANTYSDWGGELGTMLAAESQPSTSAVATYEQTWTAARLAYDAATKLKANDPPVQTDRSIATFYSGDATGAIVIVRKVIADTPTFALGWFNIGLFYDQTGQAEQAVLAYRKYLVLDPKGTSAQYAQQRVDALAKGSTAATP